MKSGVQCAAERLGDGATARLGLPAPALAYLLLVLGTAGALALDLLFRLPLQDLDGVVWGTVALLAAASALAHVFVVVTPRNQSYHSTIAFLIPAALLLPPELLPLVAVMQHVPEWLKERYPWYIQSFNIANYALDLLAAWASARAVLHVHWLMSDPRLRFAAAGLVASVAFVSLNHLLLAVMLRLGRGHSWRATGLFTFESLSTDLVLAGLGVVFTALWHENPWLIAFAIASLLLIHRSLAVPALEAQTRVDAKTGLFNARHFASALNDELERARRFSRPLSVLMADLDLLREINNAHGHLAGDAVLRGVAAIFREQLRPYDVPARFGGEEFAILLPETTAEAALGIAERIRRSVAGARFQDAASTAPLQATLSIGVASFPRDGTDPDGLVHEADLAVYRAKVEGRNRVVGTGADVVTLGPAIGAAP